MPGTFRPRGQPTSQERERAYDAKRREERPWRAWYKLPIWRSIRKIQLATKPLCERCEREGVVAPATVCNHVDAHRGDWTKFVNGPFESLCKRHHDSDVHSEEMQAAKAAGPPK